MNKPYNIQNTNICNGETTRGKTTHESNGIRGETTRIHINQQWS
jgi:hypothetical protein